MWYHAPVDNILNAWVPCGIVWPHILVIKYVKHRVGVLHASKDVEFAISHS